MDHTPPNPLSELLASSLMNNAGLKAIEDSSAGWSLSYADLDERAEGAATWIGALSVETVVLCLTKSADFYSLVVACFKHGIDFCPIDPINPNQRIAAIVRQLPEAAVVCDCEDRVAELSQLGVKAHPYMDTKIEPEPSEIGRTDRGPVYYIATSGSTGLPKIVEVPFGGTLDFLSWAIDYYEVTSKTRWAQFSSIGFDLSIVDILTVLVGGGTLVPISTRVDKLRPAMAIAKSKITHWHSVPSVISYIIKDARADRFPVERFSFCGEPLHVADADALLDTYPNCKITNTYGPTEGTLFCSYYEYNPTKELASATLPIGRPIPGWDFLWEAEGDRHRLVLSSDNIANGYVGIDSQDFDIANVFGLKRKLFNTGDYFKLEDCEYFFSHRQDGMVKISGNRVDLGEVEASAKLIGLENPVCLFDGKKLILTIEGPTMTDSESVLSSLRDLLPNYGLPSLIRNVDKHPRNPNGKIDRKKLLENLKDE